MPLGYTKVKQTEQPPLPPPSSSSESLQYSQMARRIDGALPSTYSSHQLIASQDDETSRNQLPNQEIVIESPQGAATATNHNVPFTSLSKTHIFTVFVLCFINLINYMDRFTLAGKFGWGRTLIKKPKLKVQEVPSACVTY